MAFAVLGLWAFTNLDVMYTLLRCEERRRVYMTASLSNVVLTVVSTIVLVVVFDTGARGYLLGNYGSSTVVLLGAVGLRAPPRRVLAGRRAPRAGPADALRRARPCPPTRPSSR